MKRLYNYFYHNIIFYIFVVFLLGQRTFRFFVKYLIEYDPEPPHTFLTYSIQIAIICFFAFILTYLARTKILKCLILSVLLLLFAVDFYLVSNFGHPVSPYFLTLILETNSNEANGFIENYIYTKIG